ncbi:helix-turn-helix domain-containing protein [Nonomuraea dietziae]|uniref:MmyB family transcriptional regulator n=1 Tax=Nonomuraea dietziae TaxID=65515 RepID=UPI00336CC836
MNREELAEFLRSRRARVTPREVGLPESGRRRTPGLRRQEVAQLAGMSIDYYIRLEQGRGPHPSRQVLNALSRALMLSADERAYLFHLAGQALEPERLRGDVPRSILHLIAFLEEVPAYVLDAKYDILAWNPMAAALMGGLDSRPRDDLNVIRWVFRSPDLAEHLSDEEKGRFAPRRCRRPALGGGPLPRRRRHPGAGRGDARAQPRVRRPVGRARGEGAQGAAQADRPPGRRRDRGDLPGPAGARQGGPAAGPLHHRTGLPLSPGLAQVAGGDSKLMRCAR